MLWWTNKCHWLGMGRQLRAGSTHFLWAVARVQGIVIDPPSGNTSISFFCPAAGPGGRAGTQFGGESPPNFNSIE